MNKQDTEEVVFTTERRRERKNKIEKLSEHELPEREGQLEQINHEPVDSIESES